ncbi:hypothetical protein PSU4_47060 [Pseudonocardia sulfidoxydans NBRC 16205]|uniref:Uncharacterized protein n=1 Tax=Pseudonocardia sulfidoxydans NBRC 16205 TaxID=1223511 RepID=A0A511DLQ9_9PSEU|nr:hypothetical protein [Pseudonocardia sulfidoxydans]GEL25752.1 hypothetical protein PSU4_47060 [Pseudonocardia sulfidoxydans NBRC 16205]
MGLTFADRLNVVFDAYRQPPNEVGERHPWTSGQVVRAMAHLEGRPAITVGHLHLLRKGERGNPSGSVVASLARAFEYLSRTEPEPGQASALLAYLLLDPDNGSADEKDTVAGIHAQLKDVIAAHEGRPRELAIRARLGDLQDEESLQAVEEFIGQLEAKEKTRRGILRRGK